MAGTALRVRVSQLRKALPQDVVQTRAPGYLVRVQRDELDLRKFERFVEEGRSLLESGDPSGAAERLREAVELWRGPALADFAYESFAQSAIARLEELRLAAIELRVDADLALGRHNDLIGELESLVGEHPLRERVRGQLMLALYRAGRQAEALAVYQDARSVLVDQLGIEPSPALQGLEKRSCGRIRHSSAATRLPCSRRTHGAAIGPRRSVEYRWSERPALHRETARATAATGGHPRAAPGRRGRAGASTSQLHRSRAGLEESGVVARATVFTSSRVGEDLIRLASEQDVDLVLLEAPATLMEAGIPDPDLTAVLAGSPCDVALLAAAGGEAEGSVVVPFGGFEHDWGAVELGAWIARAGDTTLRLLGTAANPDAGKRDSSRLLSHASLAVQRGLGIAAEPLLVPPGEEGILEASEAAGLLVVGLSTRWHREGLGATRLLLAQEAKCPVLLVRRGLRPGGLAPRASLTRFTWSIRAGA